MTNIHQLTEQANFEVEGTRRAVFRYREAAAHKAPHELPGGRRFMRDCVPPLVEAIKVGRHAAQGSLAGSAGRPPLWAWPLLLSDPEELAVITITVAMGSIAHIHGEGGHAKAIMACKTIAKVAQEQLGFNKWVTEQTALNKAPVGPSTGDTPDQEPRRDLLAALQARHPEVDRRTWASWRRKLHLTREEPWDKPTCLAFGGWLLEALQATSGGRVTLALRNLAGGRTERYVKLSEETEELLRDINDRAEVARPLLMPMLCEPLPWDYLPPEEPGR